MLEGVHSGILLRANPDVAKDPVFGSSPFLHYVNHGAAEGRSPVEIPTAPALTQAQYDQRVAEAKERAQRDAQGRAIGIQVAKDPNQFNVAGFGLSGLGGTSMFANGGDVQKDNQGSGFNIERWIAEKAGLAPAWDKSLDAPAEMGLSEDSGTRGDAVRHMVLMREIEKKYNPTVAKTLLCARVNRWADAVLHTGQRTEFT